MITAGWISHFSLRVAGWFLFVLCLAGGSILHAAPAVNKALVPGSLYIGQVPENNRVFYQGEVVSVTPSGFFVIGFGREAELNQSYEIRAGESSRKVDIVLAKRDYDIQHIDGVAKKHMSLDKETLRRVVAENKQIKEARNTLSEFDHFIKTGFNWPLKGRITGVYGSQRVFNGEPRRPHYGLDIAAPVGTKVVAPAEGRVVLFHPDMFFSGGTMIIDHGQGVTSTFIHLNKSLVEEGAWVKSGQAVAEVGNTGRTTGPHLDWRVNWFDVRLDPALLVPDQSER